MIAFAGHTHAADQYTINSGQTVRVNEHGQCRDIHNGGSGSRIVFTKSATEWQSVISNPNGLTVSVCPPPQNCALPWGGTLPHGQSISANASATVACGGTCPAATTRTCNDGVLSGSGNFASCSVSACASCNLPWGGTLAHGQSVSARSTGSVACGGACPAATTRTCNNGALSGSGNFASCSVSACSNCTLDGVTVSHNTSRVFYSTTTSANCGANSQSRACSNGTLSGSASFNRASCSAPAGGTWASTSPYYYCDYMFDPSVVACPAAPHGKACATLGQYCAESTYFGEACWGSTYPPIIYRCQ